MELKFDSISELEQFLMFSAHIGRAFAQAPSPDKTSGMDQPTVSDNGGSTEPAAALSVGDQAGNEAGAEVALTADDAPASTDRPKRTRRTKAEMEAERAAGNAPASSVEAAQPDISATTSAATAESASTPAGANPFAQASPATQAILEAPNQSAAVLAGMAAMQSNPPPEEPAAPVRVIESIEHLRACQSFIQTYGMTKYNESFRDGLNANIAAYTPEQRAQHVAILETLAA